MSDVIGGRLAPALMETRDLADCAVAIILVNWNGWRECIECVDSLLGQLHTNCQIFIVDNDSRDSSVDEILNWCAAPAADPAWRRHVGVRRWTDRPHIEPLSVDVIQGGVAAPIALRPAVALTIVRSLENRGFAAGCNLGIAAAGLDRFDFFWLLNPDTVIDAAALVELLRRAAERPRAGMLGSTLRYYDRPDTVQALGGALLNGKDGTSRHIGQGAGIDAVPADGSAIEAQMSYVMGASMLVTRHFVDKIGPMEEDYFLYYEEMDWALRGRQHFSLGYAPRSHVFHKSGANSSKLMPLYTSGFYYRNRLRFVARFMPDRLGSAKWSLFTELLRHTARGRWHHVRLVATTLLSARHITANVRPWPGP